MTASELSWPPLSGAIRYRVIVDRDGSDAAVVDTEVVESTLSLELADADLRHRWRVYARCEADGDWQVYLPEIVIADDALAAEPEIAWSSLPGALAYRVLVRDDAVGDVISKNGFLASPGRIDWSGLDPTSPHRVRVQAWIGGNWRDHVPYSFASPPASRYPGELFELAWPPSEEPVRYRVVIRPTGGESVLELETFEESVRIARRLLASAGPCGWQVWLRESDDEPWRAHLPELVVVSEELAREPTITWPKLERARAYRVVVRDEALGVAVSKHGFLASPGRVDWRSLDPRHPHRAQVQAWVAGEWRDHVPYRTVLPPRERLGADAVELSWPPAPKAQAYRVLLLSPQGAPIIDVELESELELCLPAELLDDPNCRWRVLARRGHEAEWELHQPDVVATRKRPVGSEELRWDAHARAVAYRVLVRADTLEDVVLKDGFQSSPGWIDWSRLDLRHGHRVSVQARVNGVWESHLASRRALPPPELLLGFPSPQRAGALKHVIVVRLPAGSLDGVYGVERASLDESRLDLLRAWTLPSLEAAGEDVDWYLLPDTGVSDDTLRAVAALCGERLVEPGDDLEVRPVDQRVAVSWLLAGDALHPGAPAAVESWLASRESPEQTFAVTFPLRVEGSATCARLASEEGPGSYAVVVEPPGCCVRPADARHPLLRVASSEQVRADWSVPAVLRARPGPNEHPLVLRARGRPVPPSLLGLFAVRDGVHA